MSVWSVAKSQVVVFFPALIAGWTIALAYFAFAEAVGHTATAESALPERVEAVLNRFGPVVIPLAAASMIAAAGIANGLLLLGAMRRVFRRVAMKIADRIYQWAIQPIEADIESRGEARGIARTLEWARRKAEAERDGAPFYEPPPEPMPPPER